MFRWGIVGCGKIARFHANAIQELEESKLVACMDSFDSAAKQFSKEFHIPWYATLEKLLDNVDIISICTPSGSRKEIVLNAAKRGIHVITEKPIEISLPAIDEMIMAADMYGIKLGCILQSRAGKAERKLKELLDAEELGRIVIGEASVKWFRSEDYYQEASWRGTWKYDGGGALLNQSIHTIDLLQWYLGPVKRISGMAKTLVRHIEVEDGAAAVLEFSSGALGIIEGSTAIAPGFPRKIGIYGAKQSAEIIGENLFLYSNTESPSRKILVKESGDPSVNPMSISYKRHKIQLMDFLSAVKEDRSPMVDGEEARKAVEIILGIYKASQSNEVLRLPLSSTDTLQ